MPRCSQPASWSVAALEAAKLLAAKGVGRGGLQRQHDQAAGSEALVAGVAGVRAIVVAEEHNVIGGLGSAVLEALRPAPHAPVEFVGIEDCFGQSAACYDEILSHFGLTGPRPMRPGAGGGHLKLVTGQENHTT